MSCSNTKVVIVGDCNQGLIKALEEKLNTINWEGYKVVEYDNPPSKEDVQKAFEDMRKKLEHIEKGTHTIAERKAEAYFKPRKIHPKHQKNNKYRNR